MKVAILAIVCVLNFSFGQTLKEYSSGEFDSYEVTLPAGKLKLEITADYEVFDGCQVAYDFEVSEFKTSFVISKDYAINYRNECPEGAQTQGGVKVELVGFWDKAVTYTLHVMRYPATRFDGEVIEKTKLSVVR